MQLKIRYYKFQMGNSLATEQQDIKYAQTLEDENFGNIDIYKSP